MQVLAIVLLSIYGLVALAGIIFIIYYLGRLSVRNNPQKAIVLCKNGLSVSTKKATLHEKTSEGYSYKVNGVSEFLLVPQRYQEVYYRGKRILFTGKTGQLISSPYDKDISLSKEESNNLIYELCASHIGADGMRALQGKKPMQTIIVAIVAFAIGAIAVFGITHFQQLQATKQIQQSQPTQPTQQNKIIEVK